MPALPAPRAPRHDGGRGVDVVLPCLNEAAALPRVLRRLPRGYRAIVVDNGSTDGSAAVAVEWGATVVREPRRGFGAAAHAGLLAATAQVVCFADPDASFDLAQLPRLADRVAAGDADLVLGRRRPVGRGMWPVYARLGNAFLARRLRRRSGRLLHDVGPVRAARREALLALGLTDRRFGYPFEMVVRAADAGWLIREVEVDYLPRTGRSTLSGTVRATARGVRNLNAVLRAYAPRRAL